MQQIFGYCTFMNICMECTWWIGFFEPLFMVDISCLIDLIVHLSIHFHWQYLAVSWCGPHWKECIVTTPLSGFTSYHCSMCRRPGEVASWFCAPHPKRLVPVGMFTDQGRSSEGPRLHPRTFTWHYQIGGWINTPSSSPAWTLTYFIFVMPLTHMG